MVCFSAFNVRSLTLWSISGQVSTMNAPGDYCEAWTRWPSASKLWSNGFTNDSLKELNEQHLNTFHSQCHINRRTEVRADVWIHTTVEWIHLTTYLPGPPSTVFNVQTSLIQIGWSTTKVCTSCTVPSESTAEERSLNTRKSSASLWWERGFTFDYLAIGRGLCLSYAVKWIRHCYVDLVLTCWPKYHKTVRVTMRHALLVYDAWI